MFFDVYFSIMILRNLSFWWYIVVDDEPNSLTHFGWRQLLGFILNNPSNHLVDLRDQPAAFVGRHVVLHDRWLSVWAWSAIGRDTMPPTRDRTYVRGDHRKFTAGCQLPSPHKLTSAVGGQSGPD